MLNVNIEIYNLTKRFINYNVILFLSIFRGVRLRIMIILLYNFQHVVSAISKFGTDKLIILVDKEITGNEQVQRVKDVFSKTILIEPHTTSFLDIVKTARTVTSVIDKNRNERIMIDVSLQKTISLGALLAAYRRANEIEMIFYYDSLLKRFVQLPKINFEVSDSQRKLLDVIKTGKYKSLRELAELSEQSRAMLHRNLNELQKQGIIEKDYNKKFKLTYAARILLL